MIRPVSSTILRSGECRADQPVAEQQREQRAEAAGKLEPVAVTVEQRGPVAHVARDRDVNRRAVAEQGLDHDAAHRRAARRDPCDELIGRDPVVRGYRRRIRRKQLRVGQRRRRGRPRVVERGERDVVAHQHVALPVGDDHRQRLVAEHLAREPLRMRAHRVE